MEDRITLNDYDSSIGLDGGDTSKAAAGRWTTEEHHLFLQGLQLHNKQWKLIADLVKTRTVVQIRTHAQKYFQKLEKLNQGKRVDGMGGMLDIVVPMKTFPSAHPPSRNNSICSADSLDAQNGGVTSSEGESDSERSPIAISSESDLNISFPLVLITKASDQPQEKKKAASPRKRNRDVKVPVEGIQTALYRSKRANTRSCSDVSDATSLDLALSNDPFDDFLPFVGVDDDLDHSIYHLMEKIDWNAEEQQMIAASSTSHSSSPFMEPTPVPASAPASSLCATVTAPIQSLRQLQDSRSMETLVAPTQLGAYQPASAPPSISAPTPTVAAMTTTPCALMNGSQPVYAGAPASVSAPSTMAAVKSGAMLVMPPSAATLPAPSAAIVAPTSHVVATTTPAAPRPLESTTRALPSVPGVVASAATTSPSVPATPSTRPVIATSTMEPRAVYSSVLDELKFLVDKCSSNSPGGQCDASVIYAPTQICHQLPSLRALSTMSSSDIKVACTGYNYLTPLCSTFYQYPVDEGASYEPTTTPAPAAASTVTASPARDVPSSSSVVRMEQAEHSSSAGASFVSVPSVTEPNKVVHRVQQPLLMDATSILDASLVGGPLMDSSYRISALDEKMDDDLLDSSLFEYPLGPSC